MSIYRVVKTPTNTYLVLGPNIIGNFTKDRLTRIDSFTNPDAALLAAQIASIAYAAGQAAALESRYGEHTRLLIPQEQGKKEEDCSAPPKLNWGRDRASA